MKNSQNNQKITKAVIAAAGYGTRFLPATKNQPKEMLPIIDKPIIHYLVEEAVAAGITDIILVTRAGQGIMEDYFDNNVELERSLEDSGKTDYLKKIKDITKMANFVYVRQKKHLPYGNGTPLLAVKNLINEGEAFVYMFGDDLTISKTPVTKQLIDVYEKESPSAVLAVQEVEKSETHKYGVIKYKDVNKNYEIEDLVEKPPAGKEPSLMAQFGRFVLSYDFIEQAQNSKVGMGNELWLADMIKDLVKSGKRVIAQPIEGEWLTTGDPLSYLKATVKFALQRKDLAKEFKAFLKNQL